MADHHLREAAQSLLSSTNPRYRTFSQSQSINLVTEDLVAGHRPQGKMSTVRRFFCLFVTFDILFTSLMWLICVMMRGETLEQIFTREIVQYNIKTSLFDIVLVAVIRFVFLLAFYAILYINNWSIIALSTSLTCAFLIAKVFVFDWPNASQPVYQVFLILTSFTISWGEAWFLDFRVLPQELQAKQILEAIAYHSASERQPLLSPGRASTIERGESTVNWFSPIDTPEATPAPPRHYQPPVLTQDQKIIMASASSDPPVDDEMKQHLQELESVQTEAELESKLSTMTKGGFSLAIWMKALFNKQEEEEFNAVWLSIEEYKQLAEESMNNAWRTINLPNWRQEKKGSQKGDIVESRQTDQFGKVYRFTGIVNCPAKFLYEEFKDNITKLPEWNPTILKSELIKEISPGIDLSYQVTAGGGRGIISPRDFVILRRMAALTREGRLAASDPYCYISSGVSVQVPGYPPHRDMVRGHNKVGCWCLKPKTVHTPGGKIEEMTVFQWLMCCDLKGKIPQFVLDAAFATVMLDYIVHVRKFAADAKAKGRF